MNGIRVLLPLCLVMAVLAGCNAVSPQLSSERLDTYQRLAFVCVPAPDADPSGVAIIMNELRQTAPVGLYFLEDIDYRKDIALDVSGAAPKIAPGQDLSQYDAIAALVYSHNGGMVYLDIHMMDVKSGDNIWHYRMSKFDLLRDRRLRAHAHWTPSMIRKHFYGR